MNSPACNGCSKCSDSREPFAVLSTITFHEKREGLVNVLDRVSGQIILVQWAVTEDRTVHVRFGTWDDTPIDEARCEEITDWLANQRPSAMVN